ncbi:MAG: Ig-like domain-containing protein [Deltaproteobacteria bacterium]|nr:Ig-like domain-containing protein [Deltaproteobacteria bacterium]
MRQLALASLAFLVAASCGDNGSSGKPDAPRRPDGPPGVDIDAPVTDIDAPSVDGELPDGIAGAKGATPGAGLALPIQFVIVTYLKPQVGSMMNDPAGFTIQRSKDGPALFVSVDPATTNPPLAVGDVVSFTITQIGVIGGQKRAQLIENLTRHADGFDVTTLSTDVSAAADLVSAIDTYDSRLINLTGTIFENFATSGAGFLRAGVNTAGITNNANLQVRAPLALFDTVDLANTCAVALHNVPVGRFNAQVQLPAFVAGDVTISNCPGPTVVTAIALSQTSVRFTFSRNIKPTTVNADGSDFVFDNGITATEATVEGKTVTVTTSTQTPSTTYTATIANTITDLQNTALTTASQAFTGFLVFAKVRINEVNANIASSCDMIELRVIESGSMANFTIKERLGLAGQQELNFTFPAGFNVQKNDFVIVHTNGIAATCNPAGATQEVTTKTDQPRAMFGNNFDSAYDFWANDNGLTATDNVFTLFDAQGAIMDAVFVSNDPNATATANNTKNAAALVGMANQWDPALASYSDTVFRVNAADNLGATATNQAGNSIQRVNDQDTNSKADWTTGAGAASTWGALNPGQAAL